MPANLTTKLGQLVDVLTPDTTNTRIGVANASPTRTLDVTGTGGFSGNLNVGGTSNVATGTIGIGVTNNAAVLVDGRLDANTNTYGYRFVNGSAGTGATTLGILGNGTHALQLTMLGTAFTTSTIYRQGGASLVADGPGGLTFVTQAVQPIYFAINSVEKMRLDTSGNLCVGTTNATGRLNISNGSVYLATSGQGNTAGPVAITIPSDTDGFILLNAVQSGVGKVSYIVHYMNVSGTVTSNTVSTLVTGTSPITAITPGTNVITLTLFAANTNVNWGMYNGPRG